MGTNNGVSRAKERKSHLDQLTGESLQEPSMNLCITFAGFNEATPRWRTDDPQDRYAARCYRRTRERVIVWPSRSTVTVTGVPGGTWLTRSRLDS
jgi:hypothetical protein